MDFLPHDLVKDVIKRPEEKSRHKAEPLQEGQRHARGKDAKHIAGPIDNRVLMLRAVDLNVIFPTRLHTC